MSSMSPVPTPVDHEKEITLDVSPFADLNYQNIYQVVINVQEFTNLVQDNRWFFYRNKVNRDIVKPPLILCILTGTSGRKNRSEFTGKIHGL